MGDEMSDTTTGGSSGGDTGTGGGDGIHRGESVNPNPLTPPYQSPDPNDAPPGIHRG
jgi:hypothetical protein